MVKALVLLIRFIRNYFCLFWRFIVYDYRLICLCVNLLILHVHHVENITSPGVVMVVIVS